METVAPLAAVDFNFDSTCSSPYMTAPSSPQRFDNFLFSAPASPTRISSLYANSEWDEKPESNRHDDDSEDFEFNFSGQFEKASLSADELFDGGKIRPLKPHHLSSAVSCPQSRQQQIVHKKSKSLSPIRLCDIMLEQEQEQEETSSSSQKTEHNLKSCHVPKPRKWNLKDLLLFRSASEGRAASKDPLRKYSLLSRKEPDDVRNASFRSIDSLGSVSCSRRRGGAVSAHELHYMTNRAVSEELKRKTFLPYKPGLLGCLGFHPGMHPISRGFGSLTR